VIQVRRFVLLAVVVVLKAAGANMEALTSLILVNTMQLVNLQLKPFEGKLCEFCFRTGNTCFMAILAAIMFCETPYIQNETPWLHTGLNIIILASSIAAPLSYIWVAFRLFVKLDEDELPAAPRDPYSPDEEDARIARSAGAPKISEIDIRMNPVGGLTGDDAEIAKQQKEKKTREERVTVQQWLGDLQAVKQENNKKKSSGDGQDASLNPTPQDDAPQEDDAPLFFRTPTKLNDQLGNVCHGVESGCIKTPLAIKSAMVHGAGKVGGLFETKSERKDGNSE